MNTQEYMLNKLQQELVETAHAASKCQEFGLTSVDPRDGSINAHKLLQEFAEVQAVLELCYELGVGLPVISDEALRARKEEKKLKVLHYMEISRSLGTLLNPYEQLNGDRAPLTAGEVRDF